MILLRRTPDPGRLDIVALFGVGMVGGAILHALTNQGYSSKHYPLDWLSQQVRAIELEQLVQGITKLGSAERVHVVWAAGKAGLASSQEALDDEKTAFIDILSWARRIRAIEPSAKVFFHLVSSGGGLFEGQRYIGLGTEPLPRRPYGWAKLEQERLLLDSDSSLGVYIYRPSSVYGCGGLRCRAGLVSVLIDNAALHATSHIFGGLDTVRDFVLSYDVGEFIARQICHRETGRGIFTLASGKATSIKEMLEIVRKVVGRPLYLKLDSNPPNASHITYRASVLPADWHPTDLETGIRQVSRQLSLFFEAGLRR